jgi:four helix bundle protein
MHPKALALQDRTHQFFLRVTRFCDSLPPNPTTRSIGAQLLDSAGSTDSNYRGACRARSHDEFISKIGVAAEEADESKGWLSVLLERGYGDRDEAGALIRESDELTAILTASHKTACQRRTARRQSLSDAKMARRKR